MEEPLQVALVSLGCPKNLVDSERILAHLAEAGHVVGAPMDDADVIVINTCGFLDAARIESMAVIAEAIEHKRTGRARRVVVAGCLVQRDGRKLYGQASGIDAIVGIYDRQGVVAAVEAAGEFTTISPPPPTTVDDTSRFRLTPRHTAYLRISEGCSQGCSFCTIPSIRGPFRSKPVDVVLAEASELIADGAVELNVIGQDTTSYGRDLPAGVELADLLRRVAGLDGAEWVRLLYAYPTRLTDALMATMAECPQIVPYVDLPLQHICDGVLRRMRRGVTRKCVEDLLAGLRRRVAGVTIRTTFLVGFPGESDGEFQELLDFVRGFRFDALGVFAFSPEPGTPAVKLDSPVGDDVKSQRVEAIMLAQQEIAFAANRGRIGAEIDVLVDGMDGAGYCRGRHSGQAPDIDSVCYLSEPRAPGLIVPARVMDFDDYDLIVSAED